MKHRTSASRRFLMVAAAAVVLAGCAGIPSSGPVERVAADSGLDQSTVRYAPVGPPRDASPQQIVRGYLDAMLAYPVSTGTAALYLTPEAAEEWRSSAGVTVYTEPKVTLPGGERPGDAEVSVVLRTREVARLDQQGHHTRSTDHPERTYRLTQVDGRWRITNPQAGVMVTSTYYDDYFRPFALYFFDGPGERLVPDLVHLAVGEQLPTGLVTALARGPGRSGAYRTFVPGAGSLRPSVTVSDDVADVEFSTSLAELPDRQRARLAAQIVWTLRSVPELRGVRIVGGGASILSAAGERVHPIDSWDEFGPPSGGETTYALVDDRLVEVDGAAVRPVTGDWGRDAGGAVEAAVGEDSVAAVLAGRDRVRVTDRAGEDPADVDGRGFVTPDWDLDDRLWLVDRRAGSARVRVREGDRTRSLAADGLRGLLVRSFAVSPDGGRYAATATDDGRESLYVGAVWRDRDDRVTRLGGPRRLAIGVDDPRSVSWVSTTRLGFLGASKAGVQPFEVALDGTDVLGGDTGGGPLLPDVDAVTMAGRSDGDSARWVLDGRRRLWYLPPAEGSWRLIDERGFSGLSTGV